MKVKFKYGNVNKFYICGIEMEWNWLFDFDKLCFMFLEYDMWIIFIYFGVFLNMLYGDCCIKLNVWSLYFWGGGYFL